MRRPRCTQDHRVKARREVALANFERRHDASTERIAYEIETLRKRIEGVS